MPPFDVINLMGNWGYLIYMLVGMGFGITLEMSGFGDSRKLAAQFYLKEMTVLKVMFTAVIVAGTLIFLTSSFQMLDVSKIWVNPTYLSSVIFGGSIMGLGFIIGGFCPGTSLVAAATLKLDGIAFVLGGIVGIGIFGEVIDNFDSFFNGSYFGRYMLSDLFGVSTGVALLFVVIMALIMFYFGEISEKVFGENKSLKDVSLVPKNKFKIMGSVAIITAVVLTILIGQPDFNKRYNWISSVENKKIENREIFAHPGEIQTFMFDSTVILKIIDVRDEKDFNLFNLKTSTLITENDLHNSAYINSLTSLPKNGIVLIVSNGEKRAVEFYKKLKGLGVVNLYVLEGGINNWLDNFPAEGMLGKGEIKTEDELKYFFKSSLGNSYHSSQPNPEHFKIQSTFTKKIKLEAKTLKAGGCG